MNVTLRAWRREDAPDLARFSNNQRIAANMTDAFPSPFTIGDAERLIEMWLREPDACLGRAIVVDGRVSGSICVTPGQDVYRKGGELGYCLDESLWGRGVASRAVGLMSTLAFRTLGLERLSAAPFARNAASCRVLEKAGFTLEGVLRDSVYKNGSLGDAKAYGLLRSEWLAHPTLETPRLLLRPFCEKDAADVYRYAREPEVGPAAGWPPHRDEEESLEIIRTVFAAPGVFAVEWKETGRVVGSVGFVGRHREELPGPDNEVGYALSPACWGRGLMPEAVEEVLRYGFEDCALSAIWCGHYDFNQRSRRVVEKCGFRYRFTDRAWVELMGEERTELHYALTRAEWEERA